MTAGVHEAVSFRAITASDRFVLSIVAFLNQDAVHVVSK